MCKKKRTGSKYIHLADDLNNNDKLLNTLLSLDIIFLLDKGMTQNQFGKYGH
jgi:hypothetical protein